MRRLHRKVRPLEVSYVTTLPFHAVYVLCRWGVKRNHLRYLTWSRSIQCFLYFTIASEAYVNFFIQFRLHYQTIQDEIFLFEEEILYLDIRRNKMDRY